MRLVAVEPRCESGVEVTPEGKQSELNYKYHDDRIEQQGSGSRDVTKRHEVSVTTWGAQGCCSVFHFSTDTCLNVSDAVLKCAETI